MSSQDSQLSSVNELPRSGRSAWERRDSVIKRRLLSRYALAASIVFVVFVAGLHHSQNFVGLTSAEAMDNAQLARNVSQTRGLTTSFIRPLMVASIKKKTSFPEVVNPPLYPILLSLYLTVAKAKDGYVAAFSLLALVLSAILLYVLVHRLLGSALIAALSACVYAVSRPVLASADSGGPTMLATCLFLATLLVLTPKSGMTEASPSHALRAMFVAGILAALCYLTEYTSVLYVLPAVLCWSIGANLLSRRSAGVFIVGFVLIAAPWWIRNIIVAGNPFYTLRWHELTMFTKSFPGMSRYREMPSDLSPPIFWALSHPKEMTKKILEGLGTSYVQVPFVPHLYLLPLIVASIWTVSGTRLLAYAKAGVLISLITTVCGLSLMGGSTQENLTPLAPLLSFLGMAALLRILAAALIRTKSQAGDSGQRPAGLRLGNVTISPGAVQTFIVASLLFVLIFPMMLTTVLRRDRPSSPGHQWSQDLAKIVSPDAFVFTDIPTSVAWYSDRNAIWLPDQPGTIGEIQKNLKVTTIFLSPSIASQGTQLWRQVYMQRPPIPGFTMVTRPNATSVIYQRNPSIEEAQKNLAGHPGDAQAHIVLGFAFKSAGKTHEALTEFLEAQRLRPDWAQAIVQVGVAFSRLKDTDKAILHLERALQIDPRNPSALSVLAAIWLDRNQPDRAINMYERLLADYPNNLEALNNAAYLYADERRNLYHALQYARRAAQLNPRISKVQDTMGWTLYQLGRAKEAVPSMNLAAKLEPENGTIQYHLGKVLIATGERTKGKAALRQALTLGISGSLKGDSERLLSDSGNPR